MKKKQTGLILVTTTYKEDAKQLAENTPLFNINYSQNICDYLLC